MHNKKSLFGGGDGHTPVETGLKERIHGRSDTRIGQDGQDRSENALVGAPRLG